MKTIQPITLWVNGQSKTASVLNAYGINTTLGTSATFYYSLMALNQDNTIGEQLAQGNLTMTGDDYNNWGDDDDYAWNWVANQLGLTITGDYVAPVIESKEEI